MSIQMNQAPVQPVPVEAYIDGVEFSDYFTDYISKVSNSNPLVTKQIRITGSSITIALQNVYGNMLDDGLFLCRITDVAMERLATALQNNSGLEEISITHSKISVQGVRELAKIIRNNPHLKRLDLSCNNLRDEGIKVLQEALESAPFLQSADFQCNCITDGGAEALGKIISSHRALQGLALYGGWTPDCNTITSKGFKYIVSALKTNICMTGLVINVSNLEHEDRVYILALLVFNKVLVPISASILEQWEMEIPQYNQYIQWLPRELIEELLQEVRNLLIEKQERKEKS